MSEPAEVIGVIQVLRHMRAQNRAEALPQEPTSCVMCGSPGRFRLAVLKPVCPSCWGELH